MRTYVYFKAEMKYENWNHFLMTRTTDGEKKKFRICSIESSHWVIYDE